MPLNQERNVKHWFGGSINEHSSTMLPATAHLSMRRGGLPLCLRPVGGARTILLAERNTARIIAQAQVNVCTEPLLQRAAQLVLQYAQYPVLALGLLGKHNDRNCSHAMGSQ